MNTLINSFAIEPQIFLAANINFAIGPQIFLAANNINFSVPKPITNESDRLMVATSENVKNLLHEGA